MGDDGGMNDFKNDIDPSEALKRSEERMRLITDALPVVISYLDAEQHYQFNNAAYEKFFNISSKSIINSHIKDVIGQSAYTKTKQHIETALSGQEISFEYENNLQDGTQNIFEVMYIPHIQSDKKVLGLYILSNDITLRKQAEKKLIEEKERALVTLNSICDAVITTDPSGNVEFINPIAEKLTGWTVDEARNRPLHEVFKIYNEITMEPVSNPVQKCLEQGRIIDLANHTILKDREGKEYSIEDTAAPIRAQDGKILGVVLVFKDVTESRRMAQEISYQASHDALTDLVNRREVERQLCWMLETVK